MAGRNDRAIADALESVAQVMHGQHNQTGHRANEGTSAEKNCYKCGKIGHLIADCKGNVMNFYNCGEQRNINTNFQKPKKVQSEGKVFALSGIKTASADRLIQVTRFINDIPLISIIDTGATHAFISLECAKILNLKLSSMVGSMVIDTPSNDSLNTSLVCLKYPLNIYGKSFAMNLVCLQLIQLDVILKIN
ncbi:uncharacterized protein LOC127130717 [Lathyrus oleraceus]|uniref:uncharacterized protein LOC127130717 n=1 Tax=Pisum sativum TaxID=3888 RepID=UPI0021D08D9C|nr:uncharacterized protein LOC127130717 [Pisum sativum]